jgi:glycosyltransferase involved in cell wall biosynthesis
MVLYSTPPITFNKVVSHYKNSQGSKTYLMLKDIFPQNAVDMGLIRKGSLLWRYFRKKETDLYRISDFIGCMSQGNVDYILENNKYLKRDKLEIFPNSIKPIEKTAVVPKDDKILEKYNIPRNTTLFVYGGNLGKPQGVDFLLKVADEFHKVEKGCLVIVGSGTEFDRIYSHVEIKKLKNVVVLERLPKDEYDSLMRMADVGLVFLDRRFTIPNFPSRLTSYMENSLPIIAATDTVTDIRQTIVESNSGFWCESGDLETFISYAQRLSEDKGLKMRMGNNSRKFLEENYDVTKNLDIILNHLSDGDIDDV